MGLASARNTGIMNAIGDWIYPLDSDDMMLSNCLEKVAIAIEKNPEADIISPSFKCFGKHEDTIILMPNPKKEDFKPLDFKTPLNRIGYFSAIKKEALLEIGGYSPKMTWGYEDYHLWINLLNRGAKLVTMEDVLVLYRTKAQSMITVAQAHHEELMAQIKKDFNELYS